MDEHVYIPYRPTELEGPYSFLRPAGWVVREVSEDGTAEVFLADPANPSGTMRPSFTVRALQDPAETPTEAADALVARYEPAPGFQEMGRASGTMAGGPAVEAEVAYVMSLPIFAVDAQPTTIRERHIFFRRGDHLFELLYAAPEPEYWTWLDDFRTLVNTLSWDDPAGSAFSPLITSDQ